MKQLITLFTAVAAALSLQAQTVKAPSIELFEDGIHHWYLTHEWGSVERVEADNYLWIADRVLAYQNADGGWPKNIDYLAKMDPDSVKQTLGAREGRSTFDNRNIYPQVEYLSKVYELTGKKKYRKAAELGVRYILDNQYPNGSWIGWHDEAIAYNDDIITGILNMWQQVMRNESHFDWIDQKSRARIAQSWDAGLSIILRTQYVRNGVKTAWAQQYDQQTLQPAGARTYELPSLTAQESSSIALFLMNIEEPSEEVIEAVKAVVAWLDANKIEGKEIVTTPMPEGNPEDRTIKADRKLVDNPKAKPIWARFYELADDQIFLCNRDGIKVYRLEDVLPERRVGYSWYGTWGNKVLKLYPKWLKRIEAQKSQK